MHARSRKSLSWCLFRQSTFSKLKANNFDPLDPFCEVRSNLEPHLQRKCAQLTAIGRTVTRAGAQVLSVIGGKISTPVISTAAQMLQLFPGASAELQ